MPTSFELSRPPNSPNPVSGNTGFKRDHHLLRNRVNIRAQRRETSPTLPAFLLHSHSSANRTRTQRIYANWGGSSQSVKWEARRGQAHWWTPPSSPLTQKASSIQRKVLSTKTPQTPTPSMIHSPSSSSPSSPSSLIAAPEAGLWPSTATTLASSTGRVHHHQLRGPKLTTKQEWRYDWYVCVCKLSRDGKNWKTWTTATPSPPMVGILSCQTQCGRLAPPASGLQVSLDQDSA